MAGPIALCHQMVDLPEFDEYMRPTFRPSGWYTCGPAMGAGLAEEVLTRLEAATAAEEEGMWVAARNEFVDRVVREALAA